mmetsp:Transcript_19691/g.40123  ORF Transcript_19691/g.40123 Transcript_19691/m.40123 type:complete len:260 (+) Transcript_19691:80-859(+)
MPCAFQFRQKKMAILLVDGGESVFLRDSKACHVFVIVVDLLLQLLHVSECHRLRFPSSTLRLLCKLVHGIMRRQPFAVLCLLVAVVVRARLLFLLLIPPRQLRLPCLGLCRQRGLGCALCCLVNLHWLFVHYGVRPSGLRVISSGLSCNSGLSGSRIGLLNVVKLCHLPFESLELLVLLVLYLSHLSLERGLLVCQFLMMHPRFHGLDLLLKLRRLLSIPGFQQRKLVQFSLLDGSLFVVLPLNETLERFLLLLEHIFI